MLCMPMTCKRSRQRGRTCSFNCRNKSNNESNTGGCISQHFDKFTRENLPVNRFWSVNKTHFCKGKLHDGINNKMMGITTMLDMQTSLSVSLNIPFSGMMPHSIIALLSCLGPSSSRSNKINIVSREGDSSNAITIPATSWKLRVLLPPVPAVKVLLGFETTFALFLECFFNNIRMENLCFVMPLSIIRPVNMDKKWRRALIFIFTSQESWTVDFLMHWSTLKNSSLKICGRGFIQFSK